MCINRKKSLRTNPKEQKPQLSISSNAEIQKFAPRQISSNAENQKHIPGPISSNAESQEHIPGPISSNAESQNIPGQKEKEVEKSSDVAENRAAKATEKEQVMKEEKPEEQEPLHIKVPPPRIMKAKRSPKKVPAGDPQCNTLEIDLSDWDSVKILKKSEATLDEIMKEDVSLESTQISVSDLQ